MVKVKIATSWLCRPNSSLFSFSHRCQQATSVPFNPLDEPISSNLSHNSNPSTSDYILAPPDTIRGGRPKATLKGSAAEINTMSGPGLVAWILCVRSDRAGDDFERRGGKEERRACFIARNGCNVRTALRTCGQAASTNSNFGLGRMGFSFSICNIGRGARRNGPENW